MKYNIFIKKAFLAVALLLMPSIMVADKIEIQDTTVIVVGKGQTNKKGVFTATNSTSFDSILVDEIVLTYTGKKTADLSIVDSASNKMLFSYEVTNSMSKTEMKNSIFSLLAGHTYIIKHGNIKSWNMTISNPSALNELNETTDTSNVDSNGKEKDNDDEEDDDDDEKEAETSFWWLLCVLVLITAGIGFFYWFKRNRKKEQKHEQKHQEGEATPKDDETIPAPSLITSESEESKINEINNYNTIIAQLKEEAEKGRKRLRTLKGIAALLGLKEDQLNQIEYKIGELKIKANQNKQIGVETPIVETTKNKPEPSGYEDIYTAQEEVAKELLRKFEQRNVFAKAIENAKKRCYVKEPKESEILQYLIDEIAKTLRSLYSQIESVSDKNHEPINDTADVLESESHPEWLNKRLKELFDFTCDERKSVRQNLEQLISERTETTSNRNAKEEATPSIEIEKLVEEKLTKAKVDWEADAKQDKENALAVKETEIEGLKRQLETKNGIITNLEGQIVDKNDAISRKEQIIIDKESVINEKAQIISDRDSELQKLKDKHKQELQTEVETLVGKLRQYTNAIEWRPMLDPCNNDDATLNQCTDIESRLNEKLREMKERLTGFTTVENALPEETYIAIQKALTSEITIDESVVNSLCRLFAYSNLAFMTDIKREYGVRLRRKNIHEVYETLENLYIQFGIKFQIPPLFVMESKDGDYENVTGQAYSELGNLCPNVSNHCDNIDSNMRLKDVIVDIDKIGFIKDGIVLSKARILTF